MNINDIANCANGRKKLSKANMWIRYQKMVQALDEYDITDARLTEGLVSMYQYFTPTNPAKPRTVEQWLAKSMAKDDIRFYLNYIYSDGDNLVATDGHRIHIHYGTEYAKGYYDKNLQPITAQKALADGVFPDYKRVIPIGGKNTQHEQVYKEDLLAKEIRVKSGEGSSVEMINIVEDVWVQRKYLVDALSFFSRDEPLELTYKSAVESIAIKCEDYLAVVMPIRMGD